MNKCIELTQAKTINGRRFGFGSVLDIDESIAESLIENNEAMPVSEEDEAATRKVEHCEKVLNDPKKGFKSPRHFLSAVREATQTPDTSRWPLALKYLFEGNVNKAAGSDEQSTINDAYGGFLVPESWSPEIMKRGIEKDPMAGLTKDVPMDMPSLKINARVDSDHSTSVSGGLVVSRSVETASKSSTRIKFEQIRLEANPLFGVTFATGEVMQDSPNAFTSIVAGGFQEEFSARLIDERLNGSGVGEFEGIINCPATVTVGAEPGQVADTVVYENLVNMRARCWRYHKAVWMYNQDCLPQLMKMKQDIGTAGVNMWQESARVGEPSTLFGRPAIATEFTKTVGDLGDVVLANWGEYLEGTYSPLQADQSLHVRFLNHENTFKFWMRNDGRSWWRAALTPKNSTNTLSPFVILAAR